jgi:hypothetical protein
MPIEILENTVFPCLVKADEVRIKLLHDLADEIEYIISVVNIYVFSPH